MKRLHSYGIAVVLLVSQFAVIGFSAPQSDAKRPLDCERVRRLSQLVKTQTIEKKDLLSQIKDLGVDFEMNSACGSSLRNEVDFDVIQEIQNNLRAATVVVQCEPVECAVTVNGEAAGTTVASRLTKSQVIPGSVTVEVKADNHEPQSKVVTVGTGERPTVRFALVPERGSLAISCQPDDCAISVIGQTGVVRAVKAREGKASVPELATGGYDVEVTGECYRPQTQKAWVTAPNAGKLDVKLVEDKWCRMTPLEVFDRILDSLGGKNILAAGASSKNTGKMRLSGDPPSIGNWPSIQLVEFVGTENLRWDMTIAGTKWSVLSVGPKISSKGDRKKYSGTEFGQELEHSIQLFSTMRLPAILSTARAKFDIKKGTELIMIAELPDDRYTFHLKEDFFPFKVVHEHLVAPQSVVEMEFAQNKPIGQDLKLPHVLILRYPDRPKHQHVIEYDKIDLSASTKDAFK
jgi:hypothetical protein